jgi:hypothetical protein
MPSYSISLNPYFDKIGPYDRPLTRLVLQSTDDVISPPPPLTTQPGEQWLGLVMALLGGRTFGLFGRAGDMVPLATQIRQTGQAVSAIGKWMREIRKALRYGEPDEYLRTSLEIWAVPAPFPPNIVAILQDIGHMQAHADPLLMVNEEGTTFQEYIDPLWDLGAMYWRLFPGHLRLQLDTRFVGPKELERHLQRTAQMAGVDIWPMKV